MQLRYRETSHHFRSPGLFVFLRILKTAHPDWVDMAMLAKQLPGVHPRQLARFVDQLETAGLPVVRYETKTRGRYRLAVDPEAISFDEAPEVLSETGAIVQQPHTACAGPLDAYLSDSWVTWVVALIHATLALHEGHLSGEKGVLGYLDIAEAATGCLPPWTVSVVHARRAHALERESRFREAALWLRRVDTAVRDGHAHPAAGVRAQLIRAKMHYDRSRYDEAERLLAHPPAPGGQIQCPHWLNMSALVTGRKFLQASAAEAPQLLAQTFSSLAEAFGYIFLWQGDTSLLDGLCYNFGNNLMRGVNSGLLPKACADVAMQWLAANQLVCRKLGVGDDSVLAELLFVDIGLEHGYSTEHWPVLLRQGLNISEDLSGFLSTTLARARKTGNRLEIAQCLRRQVRLASSIAQAKHAYFEAIGLFDDLGRKDVIKRIAEEWQIRFGTTPPRMFRVRG